MLNFEKYKMIAESANGTELVANHFNKKAKYVSAIIKKIEVRIDMTAYKFEIMDNNKLVIARIDGDFLNYTQVEDLYLKLESMPESKSFVWFIMYGDETQRKFKEVKIHSNLECLFLKIADI